ncbi:MAG: AbrB/MazE/SpoVT family DNA-binding domain-containing protein [Candidatus Peregrinibacteria bacterium]|nr:AbrB/MazE/SpoVT family DNA-binding domain-containing protein [Candidatus Peregrinibacteria bacterium]
MMNTYTLKLFNTGQVTLPKNWREKYDTKNFIAKETKDGLLIQPIKEEKVVYFENKKSFGLYCEEGLPIDDIINKIKEIHGSD